jgi:hypothetical protein
MITKIQYSNISERNTIIEENSNLILVEEQNIKEGNFLMFSDVPVEREIIFINAPKEEFDNFKTQLEASQEAIDFLLMGGM